MKSTSYRQHRQEYNGKLVEADGFFGAFGALDDEVYADGAIPKQYKELTGLSISVATRCNECICYHMEGCLKAGATAGQILEAVKMGVIGGGSITFPNARFAMEMLEEMTGATEVSPQQP